jgi:hypothetical protein
MCEETTRWRLMSGSDVTLDADVVVDGANIERKARVFLPYVGGPPKYMDRCNEVAAHDDDGFKLSWS